MLQTFKHSGLTIYYFFRNLNIFNKHTLAYSCTINSKINGTAKGVYLPISKLHSILAVSNLLAHI